MKKHNHHLAAILFMDGHEVDPGIPVYDDLTRLGLQQYHEVLTQHHRAYNGRIVNHYGYYCISLFNCTLDAIRCACMMQQELIRLGIGNVSMGIHIGEVLDEIEDVCGASVNLAARIQELGVPGSVLLSEIVFVQIRNHPEFHVVPLGRFAVKNIADVALLYALKEKGLIVPTRTEILRNHHQNIKRLLMRAPLQTLLLLLSRLIYSLLS
jgi:class 3 adenylate cyclase